MDWDKILERLSSPAESAGESSNPSNANIEEVVVDTSQGPPVLNITREPTPLDVLNLLAQSTLWPQGFVVEGLADQPRGQYSPLQEWHLLRYGDSFNALHDLWCPVCWESKPSFTRGFAATIGETLVPDCHHGQYVAGGNMIYWLSPESLIDSIAWIRTVEHTAPDPEGYRSVSDWLRQLPVLNHPPILVTWSLTGATVKQQEHINNCQIH